MVTPIPLVLCASLMWELGPARTWRASHVFVLQATASVVITEETTKDLILSKTVECPQPTLFNPTTARRRARAARHATRKASRSERQRSVMAAQGGGGKGDHYVSDPGAKLNKGFGILELAGGIVPQGGLVKTARLGWKFVWLQMMRELAPQSPDGSYVRPNYGFRGWIGRGMFPQETGRYHIYVGNTCPWCHRAVLAVVLRGLAPGVTFSYMDDNPDKASRGGWAFTDEEPDPVFGLSDLREVYETCSPGFKGRCTAPVIVDKKAKKIVTNESSQIVRMLNDMSTKEGGGVDLCPASMEKEIDAMNGFVYGKINNGVYRAGFATSQAAYEKACRDVFEGLARCEEVLSNTRFLCGDRFTEADLRLLPTAVRFDAVYATLFKCSNKRWRDYPALHAWLRDVYQLPGVADTIDIDGCRRSYFSQLFPLNPGGIVPIGPSVEDLGLEESAGRGSQDRSAVFYRKECMNSPPHFGHDG